MNIHILLYLIGNMKVSIKTSGEVDEFKTTFDQIKKCYLMKL
jgi:hypothetical protein